MSTLSFRGLGLRCLLFLFFVYESLQEFLRPENGVLDFLRATL